MKIVNVFFHQGEEQGQNVEEGKVDLTNNTLIYTFEHQGNTYRIWEMKEL